MKISAIIQSNPHPAIIRICPLITDTKAITDTLVALYCTRQSRAPNIDQ